MASDGCAEKSYQSYHATYCEVCGALVSASEAVENAVEEPVHRVHILEALGDVDDVHESVATDEGECTRCGGQLVKRYYAVGDAPGLDYDVDDEQLTGRDPRDDALINLGDGYQEVREVSWLGAGDLPSDSDV